MIALIIIVTILFFYHIGTRNFNYWKSKGIKYCTPVPFFGNSFQKYLGIKSPTDQLAEIYKKYPKEKCVGIFESNYPVLVLRDPEMIKRVLVSEFLHFYAKGMNMHQLEPLMNNLFSADGDLWKLLRQNISMAFSTGKLKAMYPILVEKTERLAKIVHSSAENGLEVDIRDLMARFTTDVIVACGFGIDTNSLNDGSSVFRKMGKRIFNIKFRDSLVYMFKFILTDLFKNFKFFAPEIENLIRNIIKSIFETRNDKPIERKDFINVLLEMKNKGTLVGESMTKIQENGYPEKCEIVVDEMLLVAQAFILFGAGYETSAATMSYTLHQLAFNPEIQLKCQAEIDGIFEKHGKLSYEAVLEMKYLDMVFKEGLRMFPPIGFLVRQCAKKYTFPETNLTVDKGVVVLIPLQAMQNDDKYFEQPQKFTPERFCAENANNINKYSFLPFGAGPRTCLGMRFGTIESLLGIATILSKYTVTPSCNSRRDLVTDPTIALVQNVKGGIPLKFVTRA